MSKTTENLKAAFAGESQARNKYTFFAEVARQEGYHYIAKIFEETAENEKQHAKDHLQLLNGIGDTAANLKEAFGGEDYEVKACIRDLLKRPKKREKPRLLSHLNRWPKSKRTTERDITNCSKWSRPGLSSNANSRSSGNVAYAVIFTKATSHRPNVLRAKTRENTTNLPVWIFKRQRWLSIWEFG